jgi:hypothetical protein
MKKIPEKSEKTLTSQHRESAEQVCTNSLSQIIIYQVTIVGYIARTWSRYEQV